jgi:hypothetical protein
LLLLVGATGASYFSAWRHVPICLREARVNSVTRIAFESALASEVAKLPPGSRILMFCGNHVGALQMARVQLRRVVNEGNYRLWDAALAQPNASADFLIAMDGDPVDAAVRSHPAGLTPIARVDTPGQPRATLYRTSRL